MMRKRMCEFFSDLIRVHPWQKIRESANEISHSSLVEFVSCHLCHAARITYAIAAAGVGTGLPRRPILRQSGGVRFFQHQSARRALAGLPELPRTESALLRPP